MARFENGVSVTRPVVKGTVIGTKDGIVRVLWSDGTTTSEKEDAGTLAPDFEVKYEWMIERKRWHVGILHEHIIYHTTRYAKLTKLLRERKIEL